MSTSLQDRRGHIARAGDVFSSSGRLFHSRGFGACRVMTSCIVSMSYCNSSVRTTTALNVKHCCRLVGTSVPVGICFGSFSQPPAMFCAFSSPPRRVANYAPPPRPPPRAAWGHCWRLPCRCTAFDRWNPFWDRKSLRLSWR